MMLTVRDAGEAAAAAAVGVDAVEWVAAADAGRALASARAIRAAFAGRFRLRPCGPAGDLAADLAGAPVDEVALGVEAVVSRRGSSHRDDGAAVIAVVAATGGEVEAVERLRGRAHGVMLDAGPRRLVGEDGVARLDAFAGACRRAGLTFGFAGGLEAPDVARLLLLEPDVLGFDAAARHEHGGALDLGALDAIRALIPRDLAPGTDAATASRATGGQALDVLFVRDFLTSLSIGAYRQEHGRRQRVRFSVEALVRREPVPPRDMRDVFSYDVIIETIRVLAERGHATFVETLAEEIAAALLTHAALVGVTVKVEKLDVVDGAVGIEIWRGRR